MTITITPGAIAGRIGRSLRTEAPVWPDRLAGLVSWVCDNERVRWATVVTDGAGTVLEERSGAVDLPAEAAASAAAVIAQARAALGPAPLLIAVRGPGLLEAAPRQRGWDVHGLDPMLPQTHAVMDFQDRVREADLEAWQRGALRDPLVVATDASKSRGGRACGLAAVTSEGRVWHAMSECTGIEDAEAHALAMALRKVTRPQGRHLVLESDSTIAVQALRDTIACDALTLSRRVAPHAAQALAQAYRTARAAGPIEVRWVKGHAGHALNEHADRVAVQARRAQEAHDHTVLDAVVREVRASVRGAVRAQIALAA